MEHTEFIIGQPVSMSEAFSAGQFWCCFELRASDGRIVIARVRLPRHPDSNDGVDEHSELYSIKCEVETMRFLHECVTGVPFPRLLAYEGPGSQIAANVGAAYMLIEGFYGNTLQDVQFNICELPTSVQAELATFTFPQIGSISHFSKYAGATIGKLSTAVAEGLSNEGPSKDKMQTTAGSAALIGTVVPDDARIVTLLRESGAVLMAKANLSEFASMRASYYAEGYSSRGGQNRNPCNLECHPGGSSSGSASSVASNMCAFSIGTETDGSIMFPADRNAVVGIKPTLGLVSMIGVIPESPSMDTIGPFGRCVKDAAIVLDVIREKRVSSFTDDSSLASTLPNKVLLGSYTSWLSKKDALKGARFGLPWKRVWEAASNCVEQRLEYDSLTCLIKEIERAGAQVFKIDFPSAEEIIPPNGWDWEFGNGETGSKLSEFQVVRTEFYNSLRSYLDKLAENKGNKGNIRSLEDVVAYNVQHTTQEGGVPGTHPAWPTDQDNFDKCLESKD
ncbi:hypothetical protein EAF04_000770 [Stromatinia cepivora]|nr:hypothetical protein EAF04_000770 [Stromatinia cepivora]